MNALATQHAFALIVPDLDVAAEQFKWNSAGTIMTMKYTTAVPAGTLISWGMGAGAVDLAGKALAHAETVGGSFRVLREKTVKLYSDPEKDLWAASQAQISGFGAYSARVGTEAVDDIGSTHNVTMDNAVGVAVDRMMLQFSLNKLPDLASIRQVKRAMLHTTVIHTIGDQIPNDTLMLQNVSTVKWFDYDALWNAPEVVIPFANNPSMDISSYAPFTSTSDVTEFMDYDVKHAAQLFGLSQWRFQMSDDTVPKYGYQMNNALEFAMGAYPVPSSQPYIEVTYVYP